MKEKILLLCNIALFVVTALILAGVQTSLWLQIFGYFPPPALWMPVLVYLSLFRGTLTTILLSHLLALALASATAMPDGLMMISCLGVALSVQVFKTRIFWIQSTYFMMVCGFSTLLFHILHFVSSWIFSEFPVTSPALADWIIQSLLTPLFAPVFFPLFRWFDAVTDREEPPEVTGTLSV